MCSHAITPPPPIRSRFTKHLVSSCRSRLLTRPQEDRRCKCARACTDRRLQQGSLTESANPDLRDLWPFSLNPVPRRSAPLRAPHRIHQHFFLCILLIDLARQFVVSRYRFSTAFGGAQTFLCHLEYGGNLETARFPFPGVLAIGAQKQWEFCSRTVSAVAWGMSSVWPGRLVLLCRLLTAVVCLVIGWIPCFSLTKWSSCLCNPFPSP
jgi:hypothetical protein